MSWEIYRPELDNDNLLVNESLFSLGNGYLGVRGNFEEGYKDTYQSIRGTYLNAFHDETEISYGEKLHGFPEKQQKLVNVIDAQTVNIYIDNEPFSLFEGTVIDFERKLYLDKGYTERIVHWKSPGGKEARLTFRRLVSFVQKELFAIEVEVVPLNHVDKITIVSAINGDVINFVDENDPRVASGHAKRLNVADVKKRDHCNIVKDRTFATNLEVACVSVSGTSTTEYMYDSKMDDSGIEESYDFAGDKPVCFTKYNIYTDTLRHGEGVIEKGINIQQRHLSGKKFTDLITSQKAYLDHFWNTSDVKIGGDDNLQEGIRFNIYHLLQAAGKDHYSNISAKGLSGEGYEGHYFWDTEIYMFPVFLLTNQDIAKNLLLYRYSILDQARERAKEVGHQQGALFPWRTIAGTECSGYYPAGTAQYHISADIAYSYIQYYLVTRDEAFLQDCMAEILFETARLWMDTGHMLNGEFRIDNVTGPDEYTCIVNNNYYTNVMARHNLLWAVKVYQLLKKKFPDRLKDLEKQLEMTETEVTDWNEAGEKMYLPYDDKLQINAQDDTFLQKEYWNTENTPKDKSTLMVNYHPLMIYRYQVCKQADTVLAHFLLEDETDNETIKNSYDYYEKITTHDSSLSYCIFSIMGSKLGYHEKAYQYFNETARLDLNNIHGNTKDGLHMANMGGTWLAIVYGFAGLRIKEAGLSLAPSLPEQWSSLRFHLNYQGRLLEVNMEKGKVSYQIKEGEGMEIKHCSKSIFLEPNRVVQIPVRE